MSTYWVPQGRFPSPASLSSKEAGEYARAVLAETVEAAAEDVFVWRRFLCTNEHPMGDRSFDGSGRQNVDFYARLSDSDIKRCATELVARVKRAIAIVRAQDQNLHLGLNEIDTSESSLYMLAEQAFRAEGAVNANTSQTWDAGSRVGSIVGKSLTFDLAKSLPLISAIFPSTVALSLFVSDRISPEGYIPRAEVAELLPSLAKSMAIHGFLFVHELSLRKSIESRALALIKGDAEKFACALEERVPKALDVISCWTEATDYGILRTYIDIARLGTQYGCPLEKGWSMDGYKLQVGTLAGLFDLATEHGSPTGRDVLAKAFGRKKIEELTKKKIINKKGILQTVFVRLEDALPVPKLGAGAIVLYRLLGRAMRKRGHDVHEDDPQHLHTMFPDWHSDLKQTDPKAQAKSLLDHIHGLLSKRATPRKPPSKLKEKTAPKKPRERSAAPKKEGTGAPSGKALKDLIESLVSIAGLKGEAASKYLGLLGDIAEQPTKAPGPALKTSPLAPSPPTPSQEVRSARTMPELRIAEQAALKAKSEATLSVGEKREAAYKAADDKRKAEVVTFHEKARERGEVKEGVDEQRKSFVHPENRPKADDVKGEVFPGFVVADLKKLGIDGAKMWRKNKTTRIYLNEGGYRSKSHGFIDYLASGKFETRNVDEGKVSIALTAIENAGKRAQTSAKVRVESFEKLHNAGASIQHMGSADDGADIVAFGDKVAIQLWKDGSPLECRLLGKSIRKAPSAPVTLTDAEAQYKDGEFISSSELVSAAEQHSTRLAEDTRLEAERKGKRLSAEHKTFRQLVQDSDADAEHKAYIARHSGVGAELYPMYSKGRENVKIIAKADVALEKLSPHDRGLVHIAIKKMANAGPDAVGIYGASKKLIAASLKGYAPDDSAGVSSVVNNFASVLGAYDPKKDASSVVETKAVSDKIGKELKANDVELDVSHWTSSDGKRSRIYFNAPTEWTKSGKKRKIGSDRGFVEKRVDGDWTQHFVGHLDETQKLIEGAVKKHTQLAGDIAPSAEIHVSEAKAASLVPSDEHDLAVHKPEMESRSIGVVGGKPVKEDFPKETLYVHPKDLYTPSNMDNIAKDKRFGAVLDHLKSGAVAPTSDLVNRISKITEKSPLKMGKFSVTRDKETGRLMVHSGPDSMNKHFALGDSPQAQAENAAKQLVLWHGSGSDREFTGDAPPSYPLGKQMPDYHSGFAVRHTTGSGEEIKMHAKTGKVADSLLKVAGQMEKVAGEDWEGKNLTPKQRTETSKFVRNAATTLDEASTSLAVRRQVSALRRVADRLDAPKHYSGDEVADSLHDSVEALARAKVISQISRAPLASRLARIPSERSRVVDGRRVEYGAGPTNKPQWKVDGKVAGRTADEAAHYFETGVAPKKDVLSPEHAALAEAVKHSSAYRKAFEKAGGLTAKDNSVKSAAMAKALGEVLSDRGLDDNKHSRVFNGPVRVALTEGTRRGLSGSNLQEVADAAIGHMIPPSRTEGHMIDPVAPPFGFAGSAAEHVLDGQNLHSRLERNNQAIVNAFAGHPRAMIREKLTADAPALHAKLKDTANKYNKAWEKEHASVETDLRYGAKNAAAQAERLDVDAKAIDHLHKLSGQEDKAGHAQKYREAATAHRKIAKTTQGNLDRHRALMSKHDGERTLERALAVSDAKTLKEIHARATAEGGKAEEKKTEAPKAKAASKVGKWSRGEFTTAPAKGKAGEPETHSNAHLKGVWAIHGSRKDGYSISHAPTGARMPGEHESAKAAKEHIDTWTKEDPNRLTLGADVARDKKGLAAAVEAIEPHGKSFKEHQKAAIQRDKERKEEAVQKRRLARETPEERAKIAKRQRVDASLDKHRKDVAAEKIKLQRADELEDSPGHYAATKAAGSLLRLKSVYAMHRTDDYHNNHMFFSTSSTSPVLSLDHTKDSHRISLTSRELPKGSLSSSDIKEVPFKPNDLSHTQKTELFTKLRALHNAGNGKMDDATKKHVDEHLGEEKSGAEKKKQVVGQSEPDKAFHAAFDKMHAVAKSEAGPGQGHAVELANMAGLQAYIEAHNAVEQPLHAVAQHITHSHVTRAVMGSNLDRERLDPKNMLQDYIKLDVAGQPLGFDEVSQPPRSEGRGVTYSISEPKLNANNLNDQAKAAAKGTRLSSKKHKAHVADVSGQVVGRLRGFAKDAIRSHVEKYEHKYKKESELADQHEGHARHLEKHADMKSKLISLAAEVAGGVTEHHSQAKSHVDDLRASAKMQKGKAVAIRESAKGDVALARGITPDDVIKASIDPSKHKHLQAHIDHVASEKARKK